MAKAYESESISPFSEEVLEKICRDSGRMPEWATLKVEHLSHNHGLDRISFCQWVLGRRVSFNFLVFRVTKEGNIVSFSINWTDFNPGSYRVRISKRKAKKICIDFCEDRNFTGRVEEAVLEYLYPRDSIFFGETQESGIHLAWVVRFVQDPFKHWSEEAEFWVDVETGALIGSSP